jgi:phosphohistidine phosphatase
MRAIVRGWNRMGIGVDLVLTSPLVRAAQTAKILADGLEERPELETLPALTPGHAPTRVARALSLKYQRASVALVGHEPDLGALAAWLVRAENPVPFKKGGAARIDVDAWPPVQDGTLIWLATPKLLRLVGR